MMVNEPRLRAGAERLAALQEIVLVPSKQSMIDYLRGLDAALGADLANYGAVKSSDAPAPEPLGLQAADGFSPHVFTSREPATAYALAHGSYGSGEAALLMTKPCAPTLGDFLRRGYAGVVLDPGTPAEAVLPRPVLAQAYALATLDRFAELKHLYALRADEAYYVRTNADGTRDVLVYDSREAGEHALGMLQASTAKLDLAEAATFKYLRHALEAGVTSAVVNFALADERRYEKADLEQILALIERSAATRATTATDETASVRRVKARQSHSPTPAAKRPDDAARACFAAWRQKLDQGAIAPWRFAEAFAFEMDVHVPVYGEAIDGLAWPQSQTDPGAPEQKMCAVFTRGDEIRKALAGVHPDFRRFASLSGMEALRWIWSTPAPVVSVAVDFAQPGALKFPLAWARPLLFPGETDLTSLGTVQGVAWAQLGKLPGARALHPQVLRTLTMAWRDLHAIAEPVVVTRGARSYLPLFSSPEQLAAFSAASGATRLTAERSGGAAPPFGRWLAASAGHDGMLLDPSGATPLVLEHTDLLVIDQWLRQPTTKPAAGEILAAAARLQAAGTLGTKSAGQLAADFHCYWFGVREEPGGGYGVVTHNESSYALFSSSERAEAYIRSAANLQQGGFVPRAAPVRWGGDSVFDHALRTFAHATIDAERPASASGLALDADALEAALARIDEHLKPRLAGFVWGEPGLSR